jgi:hypothetical protein
MALRSNSLVPSMVTKTRICVDEVNHGDYSGRLCNPYMEEILGFSSIFEFVSLMDRFFDHIRFPQTTFRVRRFSKEEKTTGRSPDVEVERHMSDEILENEHGKRATFIVQVQFRQNATWQGTITWAEEKKTSRFRSTLEMVKLMDNALAETEDAGFAPEGNWE